MKLGIEYLNFGFYSTFFIKAFHLRWETGKKYCQHLVSLKDFFDSGCLWYNFNVIKSDSLQIFDKDTNINCLYHSFLITKAASNMR